MKIIVSSQNEVNQIKTLLKRVFNILEDEHEWEILYNCPGDLFLLFEQFVQQINYQVDSSEPEIYLKSKS
ncbi:hypothetical protein [Paenibacillus dendritiformis]|uniref:hypothetical protein n=1 Tax=Paenibacillus dendritiformis TaxID=130049 RepID=UPI000DA7FE36|nr:hypothetical protein [Paenibacillus dendritiformis]PZM63732.1 hypothetical protein DOE73_20615 [Paenibacillus dendritiformis]